MKLLFTELFFLLTSQKRWFNIIAQGIVVFANSLLMFLISVGAVIHVYSASGGQEKYRERLMKIIVLGWVMPSFWLYCFALMP